MFPQGQLPTRSAYACDSLEGIGRLFQDLEILTDHALRGHSSRSAITY